MAERTIRLLVAPLLGALALAFFAPPASAQTSTYYTPPKIVKQGTASSPIAGTGAVTIQVFVKKDGSIGNIKLEKSTNHGDDAAAMEIAKNSTYKPGVRDAKPIDAFYTMALKFNGSSVVNDTGTTANQLLAANALIRANKFADAKTQIDGYLGAHPNDKDAEALLGVADAYLSDPAGAAAAFDAAGTVPEQFKVVAAKAYSDAAVDALKAKNNDQAIALAGKALALQVNVNTLFIRGTAYGNAQQYPAAIGDLERAKAQATAGHADAATLNAIDASLATSYLLGGQPDKGLALAQELKRRDPSNTRVDDTMAAYYNRQAVDAMKSGNRTQAVTDLENAAKAVPTRAVVLYVASIERALAGRQARLEGGQSRSRQGARHRPQRRPRELRRRDRAGEPRRREERDRLSPEGQGDGGLRRGAQCQHRHGAQEAPTQAVGMPAGTANT